jgi:hypothetical protein
VNPRRAHEGRAGAPRSALQARRRHREGDSGDRGLNDFVFTGIKRDSGLSDIAMLMLVRELHAGITVHGF